MPRRQAAGAILLAAALAGGAPALGQVANPWTPPGAAATARYPGEGTMPQARYPGVAPSARDSRYAPANLDALLSGSGGRAPAAAGVYPGTVGGYAAMPPATVYAPAMPQSAPSPFSAAPTFAPPQAPTAQAAPTAPTGSAYTPQAPYAPAPAFVNVAPYPLGTPTPMQQAPMQQAPMQQAPMQPAPIQQQRMQPAQTQTAAPAAPAPQTGGVAVAPFAGTLVPYAVPMAQPGTFGVLPMVPGALPPAGYSTLPLGGYGATWPYAAGTALPYGATGWPYGSRAGTGAGTGWPYGTGAATGWPGGLGTGMPGGFGTGVPGGFGGLGTGYPGGLGTGWPTTGYSPFGVW